MDQKSLIQAHPDKIPIEHCVTSVLLSISCCVNKTLVKDFPVHHYIITTDVVAYLQKEIASRSPVLFFFFNIKICKMYLFEMELCLVSRIQGCFLEQIT